MQTLLINVRTLLVGVVVAVSAAGGVTCAGTGPYVLSAPSLRLQRGVQPHLTGFIPSAFVNAASIQKSGKDLMDSGKNLVETAAESAAAVAKEAAESATAVAKEAAGELERVIRANPNGASFGFTLVFILVLKQALGRPQAKEQVSVKGGTILQKMLLAPREGTENTVMLFGSFVEAMLNTLSSCPINTWSLMKNASAWVAESVTTLSTICINCTEIVRPHVDAVRVGSIKYELKSGSLDSGTFVLNLLGTQRVGGLLVSNKPAVWVQVKSSEKNKSGKRVRQNGGSNDYSVMLSRDAKTWHKAHAGWLRPGAGSGASAASSQYLSFDAKWCRYVKFQTLTAYKGGRGLLDIKVLPAMGVYTSWLYTSHPVDLVQSLWDSRYPGMWGDVHVPIDHLQDNVTHALAHAYRLAEGGQRRAYRLAEHLHSNVTHTLAHASASCNRAATAAYRRVAPLAEAESRRIANVTTRLARASLNTASASYSASAQAFNASYTATSAAASASYSASKKLSAQAFNASYSASKRAVRASAAGASASYSAGKRAVGAGARAASVSAAAATASAAAAASSLYSASNASYSASKQALAAGRLQAHTAYRRGAHGISETLRALAQQFDTDGDGHVSAAEASAAGAAALRFLAFVAVNAGVGAVVAYREDKDFREIVDTRVAPAVRQVRDKAVDELKAAATAAGGAATAAYAGVAGVSGVAGEALRSSSVALRGAALFLSGTAVSLCSLIASKVGSLVQKSFQTVETSSKKPNAKGRK